jgi:anti-sigma-K factor RskA
VNRRDWHADGERLHEDLAAYALGALDRDEQGELERHVEGCEQCRERVEWLRPAVDLLPASVEQRTPPDSLRASLMETVTAEADAAPASEPESRRVAWWESLRTLVLRPAVGMAALIVLTVGVAGGYLLRGTDTVETGSQVVKAEPIGDAVAVSATLERTGDSAILNVQELPAIDRDEVYEVWVQRAGVLEPRGTFVLESDGTATAAVPGPLEGGEKVFVSREPRGGSRQPTTRPLLEAPLG